MKKYTGSILLILLLSAVSLQAQPFNKGRARGLFWSIALGPRIPISAFSNSQALGVGINMELSYTDNEYLPLFIYTRLGFEHYPGSVDFYRKTDYSSLTANVIPINVGARIFLPPIIKDIILLIPTFELGGSFAIYENSHQFKLDSGRSNYLESNSKLGFHIGGGLSMFLIEVTGAYNYFPNSEYLSMDLRIRIPIFIQL